MPNQQELQGGGTRFNRMVSIGASVTTLAGIVAGVLLYVNGYVQSKGSDINIVADLSFTEIDGSASGAMAVQNPIEEDLLCDQVVLDITAASTAFLLDVGTAANATSSGQTLANNFRVDTTGVFALTGSDLRGNSQDKVFKLSASGSTTDYITLFSRSGSGHVTGKFNARCRRRI